MTRRAPGLLTARLLLLLSILTMRALYHAPVALPAGFEDEGVTRIPDAVDIAFAGNIMLAVTKAGILYSFDLDNPGTESPQQALDLRDSVCDNGERGYVGRFDLRTLWLAKSFLLHFRLSLSLSLYCFCVVSREDLLR